MTRDVYCVKCGNKMENVQFDDNNQARLHCNKCGHKFTLTMNICEVLSGIPIYTPEQLAKEFMDKPAKG